MQNIDINSVVQIHLHAFENFFLSFLGPAFLRELYIATLCDPSGIAFVYKQESRILGFVSGTAEPEGFYKRLLRVRWFRFGMAALVPVIRQPKIIPRLLRALQFPQANDSLEQTGTLMSVAVLPEARRKGVGKKLVLSFLEEASLRNLDFVNLTTDKINNDVVNIFYRSLGFSIDRSFETPQGRLMNEYMIQLDMIRADSRDKYYFPI
ncbi:GNAT family N-acetyltransferase [Chloroflexota bacterium]